MISPADFVRLWNDDLAPLPSELVETTTPSDKCKRFLTEAGLPPLSSLPDKGFILLSPPSAAPAPFVLQHSLLEKVVRFRLLATSSFKGYGDYLAFDEQNSGRIVYHAYSSLQRGYAFFLNTTVSQFAESLLAYRDYVEGADMGKGLATFADKLERIDAPAFAQQIDGRGETTQNYWAGVLKNLEETMQ